jgi:low affinity Fe/Cu permease
LFGFVLKGDYTMQKEILFTRFARAMSRTLGHPLAFGLAVLVVIVWMISGPLFHFTDTWQLVINTGTTIITFLMVFLIQNTQNRDSEAMQVKLDEVIRALKQADNAVLASEDLTEQELRQLQQRYSYLAQVAQSRLPTHGSKAGSEQ